MVADVSVIMSVFNNAGYLAEAVESILQQTMANFELIIVNDGSSDNSPAILDEFARTDKRVKIIHQANKGLTSSLNFMLNEAKGIFVARMDGDDIACPDRLAKQLAFMSANADIGVVGTQIALIDERGELIEGRDVEYPEAPERVRDAALTGPLFCHPSVMMRRDLILGVGGYRQAFRHCEDYDLWLRLMQHTNMANLPERLLFYRRSPDQVTSRHAVDMLYGAHVAALAYRSRLQGHADPMRDLDQLPRDVDLDRFFPGMNAAVSARVDVVSGVRYHAQAIAGAALPYILGHLDDVRQGRVERIPGLWQAAARALRAGYVAAYARIALALLRS